MTGKLQEGSQRGTPELDLEKLKTSRTWRGSWAWGAFLFSLSDLPRANLGRDAESREEHSRTSSTAFGQDPGSTSRDTNNNRAFLVAQRVKNPPAKQETRVQVPSPGQEDPLEKGMPTYSSILAWRIPWTEEPGRLQSRGLQRVGHN